MKIQLNLLLLVCLLILLVLLWKILPPIGWAVIGLIVLSYGICWIAERAITRVWRR